MSDQYMFVVCHCFIVCKIFAIVVIPNSTNYCSQLDKRKLPIVFNNLYQMQGGNAKRIAFNLSKLRNNLSNSYQ